MEYLASAAPRHRARRQIDRERGPLRLGSLPRFAGELVLIERQVSKSSGADGVRFPEAAGGAERFEAPVIVVDDEYLAGFVAPYRDDVIADRLHEIARARIDDVAGAGGGDEQPRVARHRLNRARALVAAREAADPPGTANTDAHQNAAALTIRTLGRKREDLFARGNFREDLGRGRVPERLRARISAQAGDHVGEGPLLLSPRLLFDLLSDREEEHQAPV